MKPKKNKQEKKVPYYRKPDDMTLEEWQIALRRQFAYKQDFKVRNVGSHPVFSDFMVFNPQSGNEYKVAIRDYEFGMNFCSCFDFKKNGLGTCKHIEFVLKQLKDDKNNEPYWQEGPQRDYSSVSLKYGEQRQVWLRLGTDNREEIKNLAKKYFDESGFLKPDAYQYFSEFLFAVRDINKDFVVYRDALDYIIEVREKNYRNRKIDELITTPDSSYFDSLIRANLYPYQREGVLFLAKAGRALLADDMGLGKTIQAIAATELLAKEFSVSNVLVICPTSLKYQWKNEIEKFTDRDIKVVEGNLDKRKFQYLDDAFYKIASYGVALNDLEYLNKAGFDLVILDEAQRIKNWKTKTAQNLKKLQSSYAFVLTGTPLENKLDELHSIVEFIDPYRLGSLFRFLDKHQTIDGETGKVTGYHNLNEINTILKEILLRRTKAEILQQLPERIDKNYFTGLTKEQSEIHEDYRRSVAQLVHKWQRQGFLNEPDRKKLMINLNCMRMVSDSTFILDQKTRFDTKIDELTSVLKDVFESGNDKVVVFSQWERMTRLVAWELEEMGVRYEYLHGGVPSAKRKHIIDNFREDENIKIFLSTDAGGVGLNLQSASVLINLDLPWNPAVLEQRIARIHRLGQQKSVRIINFISKYSIEHRILYLLGIKKALFSGVLDGGEDRIVLDNNRFNKLMDTVSKMTEEDFPEPVTAAEFHEEEQEEKSEKEIFKPRSEAQTLLPEQEESKGEEQTNTQKSLQGVGGDVNDLITTGLGFLEKLGSTFSAMQKGEVKVTDFVEKDPKTGQTSLKIPVKSEQTVTDAINAIANFFHKLKS